MGSIYQPKVGRELVYLIGKIRVSYTDPEELQLIIKLLQPVLRNVKVAKNDQGKYKKAYIEVKGLNKT